MRRTFSPIAPRYDSIRFSKDGRWRRRAAADVRFENAPIIIDWPSSGADRFKRLAITDILTDRMLHRRQLNGVNLITPYPVFLCLYFGDLYKRGTSWALLLHRRPRMYTYIPDSLRAFPSRREMVANPAPKQLCGGGFPPGISRMEPECTGRPGTTGS